MCRSLNDVTVLQEIIHTIQLFLISNLNNRDCVLDYFLIIVITSVGITAVWLQIACVDTTFKFMGENVEGLFFCIRLCLCCQNRLPQGCFKLHFILDRFLSRKHSSLSKQAIYYLQLLTSRFPNFLGFNFFIWNHYPCNIQQVLSVG